MNWKRRIERAFDPNVLDPDVVEELSQHADATYAAARAEGCDTAEAERLVGVQIHAWVADPSQLRRRPRRAPAVDPPSGSASPLDPLTLTCAVVSMGLVALLAAVVPAVRASRVDPLMILRR